MVAVKVKAKVLETEQGVTIKDRATGAAFCAYVENGVMKTGAGACDDPDMTPASAGDESGGATPPPADPPSDPEPDSGTVAGEESDPGTPPSESPADPDPSPTPENPPADPITP